MIVRVDQLTYWYPREARAALNDVTCEVTEGSFALVAGPSAGGKSTFLRLFNGLVPQFYGGRISGTAEVAGLDPFATPAREMSRVAGLVFQEPEAQAVVDVVEDEIAFGMEQQGVAPREMRQRIDALLAELGIGHLRERRLATLSGGERQRVAIASVLGLEPRLLILDEPTSQLDPAGAQQVIGALGALRRRGLTILVAEHRLEHLLPVVDSVYEVEGGRVRHLEPREAAREIRAVPPVCEFGRRHGIDPVPLTPDELRAAIARQGMRIAVSRRAIPAAGDTLLSARGLTVRYGQSTALREASFDLQEGEVVALVGANGSGKSTLFRAISGVVSAEGELRFGEAAVPSRVQDRTAFAALVPQDPAIALYHESVREEVADTLHARRSRRAVDEGLEHWGVAELADRNPRDLSVGQQQRVAIGAMLAHGPRVWLMDEPTRGADAAAKEWLASRLQEHAAGGGAAIVATHDIESAARYATRVIALEEGRITFDLPVEQALGHGGPMPTQMAEVAPGALTVGEVVRDEA